MCQIDMCYHSRLTSLFHHSNTRTYCCSWSIFFFLFQVYGRSNVSLIFRMLLFLRTPTFHLAADFIIILQKEKCDTKKVFVGFVSFKQFVLNPNYSNYCAQFRLPFAIPIRTVALIESILWVLHARLLTSFVEKQWIRLFFRAQQLRALCVRWDLLNLYVSTLTQLIVIEAVSCSWSLSSIIEIIN